MVKLLSASATHVGLVRTNNEDAYLAMPEAGVFAISDGMGGAAAGEIASRYFVDSVQQVFSGNVPVYEEARVELVKKVFRFQIKPYEHMQRKIRRMREWVVPATFWFSTERLRDRSRGRQQGLPGKGRVFAAVDQGSVVGPGARG